MCSPLLQLFDKGKGIWQSRICLFLLVFVGSLLFLLVLWSCLGHSTKEKLPYNYMNMLRTGCVALVVVAAVFSCCCCVFWLCFDFANLFQPLFSCKHVVRKLVDMVLMFVLPFFVNLMFMFLFAF